MSEQRQTDDAIREAALRSEPGAGTPPDTTSSDKAMREAALKGEPGGGDNVVPFARPSPTAQASMGLPSPSGVKYPVLGASPQVSQSSLPIAPGVDWESLPAPYRARFEDMWTNMPPDVRAGFKIISGSRTVEQQAAIRASHEAMPGGVAAHPAALPDKSEHNPGHGGAVDVEVVTPAAQAWLYGNGQANMRKFGLQAPIPNDSRHIQLIEAGGAPVGGVQAPSPTEFSAEQAAGYASLNRNAAQSQKLIDELLKEDPRKPETMRRLAEAQDMQRQYMQQALKLQEKMPSADPREPMQKLGGLATIVGILGGLLTKSPLSASLNAGAAAMEAYKAQDDVAYKRGMEQWNHHTDLLLKMAKFEQDTYKEILDDEKITASEKAHKLNTVATLLGGQRMADATLLGNLQAAHNHVDQMGLGYAQLDEQKRQHDLLYDAKLAGGSGGKTQLDRATHTNLQIRAQQLGKTYEEVAGSPDEVKAAMLLAKQELASAGKGVGPLSPTAAKRYAEIFEASGYLPPGISRSSAAITQIMNETGAKGTPGDFIANMASKQADTKSLANMTKLADAAVSFENTAIRNFDQALKLAPAVVPTEWGPWINRWIENGKTQFGDIETPAYVTALLTAANEYAKVMQGSTGAQGATVDARREAAELFSPYLSNGQIQAVVGIAKREMENRKEELYYQVDDIKNRLRKAGSLEPAGTGAHEAGRAPATSGAPQTPPWATSSATGAGGEKIYTDGVGWFHADHSPVQ